LLIVATTRLALIAVGFSELVVDWFTNNSSRTVELDAVITETPVRLALVTTWSLAAVGRTTSAATRA
jgi:hypothetical protein